MKNRMQEIKKRNGNYGTYNLNIVKEDYNRLAFKERTFMRGKPLILNIDQSFL